MQPVKTNTPTTVEPARSAVYLRTVLNVILRFGLADPDELPPLALSSALGEVVENSL